VRRDWSKARLKIEDEGYCRACGSTRPTFLRGLPIIPDSAMGTGCFQIRCPGQDHYSDSQQTPETEPLKEVAV